jgi:cysteine synthase
MSVLAVRGLFVADSAVELIGRTPMARLARFSAALGAAADIFAKCEFLSPGGSVKDRLGLGLILAAEREGKLKPGATIIEPTAGNTGIGLALVGAARGYKVVLCVPEKYSIEKQKAMAALGGTVVRTPNELGMKGAIEKAHALAKEIPNSYVPQQFANPANPKIHYETTGPEIFEQMEGRIDAIAIGGGTTGTFVGIARYVKERLPDALCALVEPQGSIFGGGQPGPHKVEGIGNSFWPEVMDKSLMDEVLTVDDDEAFAVVKEIARVEGFLVGGSSGANAAAARRLARRLGPGKRVVTVFPDSAERYMSQGILD